MAPRTLLSVVASPSCARAHAEVWIAPARASTRIVWFKFSRGMSAGGGSAPWPVRRGVLSRYPPQSQIPLVRFVFFEINTSPTFIYDVNDEYFAKIITVEPRFSYCWPKSNGNMNCAIKYVTYSMFSIIKAVSVSWNIAISFSQSQCLPDVGRNPNCV